MAEIAVLIIDPAGNRFAQLVDDRLPIQHLLPLLTTRLGLPEQLDYRIVSTPTGRALDSRSSLAAAGVAAGAELRLEPVRDGVLKKLLDALYDEAKDYAKDKLWEEAKERLEEVFRLDPNYPDRDGLRVVDAEAVPGPANPAAPSAPSAPSVTPRRRVSRPGPQPTAAAPIPATRPMAPPGPAAPISSAAPVAASKSGCFIFFVVMAVVGAGLTVVVVAVAAIAIIAASESDNGFGIQEQTKGSFTARQIPSGASYYFTVTSESGDQMEVVVAGTDGYNASFDGSGSLETNVIPKGQAGVVDTILVRSLDTGEEQTFYFTFG